MHVQEPIDYKKEIQILKNIIENLQTQAEEYETIRKRNEYIIQQQLQYIQKRFHE